jgi:hypothetical protein
VVKLVLKHLGIGTCGLFSCRENCKESLEILIKMLLYRIMTNILA